MVITLDHELPTEEELTVPELKLSGPALRAGAFHLGKYCQDTFNVRTTISIPFSPCNSILSCARFLYMKENNELSSSVKSDESNEIFHRKSDK